MASITLSDKELSSPAAPEETFRPAERKREQAQRTHPADPLREVGDIFRAMGDATPVMIWMSGPDKLCTYFNKRWLDFTGRTLTAELGEGWAEGVHPEDLPRCLETYATAFDARQQFEMEYRLRRHDGVYRWVLDIGAPRSTPDGRFAGYIGSCLDITDRKAADEARYHLASIVESSEDAIIGINLDGIITSWNAGAEHLFGYTAAEAHGRLISMLVPSDRSDEVLYMVQLIKEGQRVEHRDTVRVGKDGTRLSLSVRISPIRDDAGTVVGASMIARDITERKQAEQALRAAHDELEERVAARTDELTQANAALSALIRQRERDELALRERDEQLRQAQKMEAIGILAGGIAHDFNNLLTAIIGYSDLALRHLDPQTTLYRQIGEIKSAAVRAAELTRQLLAFSRKQILRPRVVDPNAIITHIEKMLRRLIGEDIELRLDAEPGVWPVKVDPGQLEQVILNLSVNARDAMPEGGILTITTRNLATLEEPPRHLDGMTTTTPTSMAAGPYVLISVSDTGTGMEPAVQEHIFEPFFTTKEVGKGTGLGLSTVYGIVVQSGGHIAVESGPGCGAIFRIYLPRADEKTAEGEAVVEQASVVGGAETILLVEDEDLVRRMLKSALEGYGYTVLAAANGEEALRQCQEFGGQIDIMVTDVVMPQISGPRLADRVAEIRPDLPVLYMSGYTDEAVLRRGLLPPGTSFIEKPFTPDLLAHRVRSILDALQPRW